jgi:tetratricopeptide (TPR) repeat protein
VVGAREQGDADTARVRLEESLALNRRLGNESAIVYNLQNLGEVAIMQEDAARATALLEESLSLFRALQSREGTAWSLNHLGQVAQMCGEYERAISLHTESLPLFRELGEKHGGLAWAQFGLGETFLAQAAVELGRAHLGLGLTVFYELGDRQGMAMCLAGLAMAAAVDEDPWRAARLWGAAEALRQSIGARGAPASRVMRERLTAIAREQLGEEAFAAAWDAGAKMTMDQAIEFALEPSTG